MAVNHSGPDRNAVPVFRLIKPETITVTVYPVSPGGEQARFRLTLRYLGWSERKALDQRLSAGELTDGRFARELVTDWSGVADEQGGPLPFSPEGLEAAMEVPFVHRAIIAALWAEVFGRGLEKNSPAPGANGQPAH